MLTIALFSIMQWTFTICKKWGEAGRQILSTKWQLGYSRDGGCRTWSRRRRASPSSMGYRENPLTWLLRLKRSGTSGLQVSSTSLRRSNAKRWKPNMIGEITLCDNGMGYCPSIFSSLFVFPTCCHYFNFQFHLRQEACLQCTQVHYGTYALSLCGIRVRCPQIALPKIKSIFSWTPSAIFGGDSSETGWQKNQRKVSA